MKNFIWIIVGLVGLFFIIVILFGDDNKTPIPPGSSGIDWQNVRDENPAVISNGWSKPVLMEVSDLGWEDSVFISKDGEKLYFTYYPAEDLLAAVAKGEFIDDLDIYVSELEEDSQFRTKRKVSDYYLSEDVWSEVGIMIDNEGNIFYDSNRDWINDQKSDNDVYMNSERLGFNDDGNPGNPFYCESLDELYMDFPADERLGVIKNAKSGGFSGFVELLPEPINIPGNKAFQATLTEDCQMLFFTSSLRGGDIGNKPGFSAIYKSIRIGDEWGVPEFVVGGNVLVGESSITEDGSRFCFLRVFESDGSFTSDIYCMEKI
jgi:hypothetical protein